MYFLSHAEAISHTAASNVDYKSTILISAHDSIPHLPEYTRAFTDIPSDLVGNMKDILIGSHLGEWLLLVMSIVGIGCLIYLFFTLRRSISDLSRVNLKWVFLITWFYGFMVYDIGMYTQHNFSLLTNAPLAVLYGFKIFLLDSDVSEIHEAFHQNWLFSGNFALVHSIAACVTALFLIKHFGFNIYSRLKMWLATTVFVRWRNRNNLYLFWGLNDATCCLAESIKEHYGDDKKAYRTVIVRTNDEDDDSPENRTGFIRIMDFISMKNSDIALIENLGCLTTGTYANLADVTPSHPGCAAHDIIGKCLRFRNLRKILKYRVKNKIHVLFLSDNEDDNLRGVNLLMKDSTLREFAESDESHEVVFYCHARYNSAHRVIEDCKAPERMKVKIVDSSRIHVDMLKQNEDILPVNFVDVDADATVSSPFDSLVIGFSEVGKDCVRFLYEFGAFVSPGSTTDHAERSSFHMHVVDKRMSDLAGTFISSAPAIKPSLPFIKGGENPDALLTLHQMDCMSAEFYLKLEEWIDTLNYVVVATDNDELNINTAVRIFKTAVRHAKDMNKFCILVRAHNDSDGHIERIARHYNRVWMAHENEQPVEGRKFIQQIVTTDTVADKPIYLFGLEENTYTYKNVIDDSIEKQAVEFKEKYESSTNLKYRRPTKESEKAWYVTYRERMYLTPDLMKFCPPYSALMNLRRTQGQDLANSRHAITKSILVKKAMAKAGIRDFDWTSVSRKTDTTVYSSVNCNPVSQKMIRILEVLAQTEHLRWVASHEILGYTCFGDGDYRDEVRMQHACITSWDNLSDQHRSYDYNVVDVTLGIASTRRPLASDDTHPHDNK